MSSTEYLNYETGKFSKSKGIGVFGSDARDSGIPADMWRFYIFYNRPEKADTLFTWKDFQDRVNSELIGNLGNLVNRTCTFVSRYYEGRIPAADGFNSTRDDIRSKIADMRDAAANSFAKITELLEWAELRDAFKEVFALSSIANKAFQDWFPFKNRTADPEFAEALIRELCYLIKDLMILVHPYMPGSRSDTNLFWYSIWVGRHIRWTDLRATLYDKPERRSGMGGFGRRERPICYQSTGDYIPAFDDAAIHTYRGKIFRHRKKKRKGNSSDYSKHVILLRYRQMFCLMEKLPSKPLKLSKIERHPDAEKPVYETLDDGPVTER